jgi:hypothetical protein
VVVAETDRCVISGGAEESWPGCGLRILGLGGCCWAADSDIGCSSWRCVVEGREKEEQPMQDDLGRLSGIDGVLVSWRVRSWLVD